MADPEAARLVALRIAKAFKEVVPYWKDLSADQRNGFVVEILDDADRLVLTVPFADGNDPEPT